MSAPGQRAAACRPEQPPAEGNAQIGSWWAAWRHGSAGLEASALRQPSWLTPPFSHTLFGVELRPGGTWAGAVAGARRPTIASMKPDRRNLPKARLQSQPPMIC